MDESNRLNVPSYRRRFRFELRSMFVLVTAMAVAMFVVSALAPPPVRVAVVIWFTGEVLLMACAIFIARFADRY